MLSLLLFAGFAGLMRAHVQMWCCWGFSMRISILVCISLARVAGLGEYSSESKSVLYGRLKTQYDLQRLGM